MKITLNGKEHKLAEAISLEELIRKYCKNPHHVISELNDKIIKSNQRDSIYINQGDKVELISFVGGG